MNAETRICQNCKNPFAIEPEDFQFYEKIKVPPPTFCPECRMVRRMLFRNLRFLFKRKCDFTGKQIFSVFHPDVPVRVYDDTNPTLKEKIDPLSFGMPYNQHQTFLKQLYELSRAIPWPSIPWTKYVSDSPYATGGWLKNCYLCFNAGYDENCAYSVTLESGRECYDTDYSSRSELCSNSVNIHNCYQTHFSVDCNSCRNVWLSRDLKNCTDCFGSAGLRNKRYCIFNEQKTKGEYAEFLVKTKTNSRAAFDALRLKALEIWNKTPVKFASMTSAVNCTGDYIRDSSNAKISFFTNRVQDSAFCQLAAYGPVANSYDAIYVGINANFIYDTSECGVNVSNIKFCWEMIECHHMEYCMFCENCSDCFGCVGLSNKQYCVLNQQYSKDEYESLIERIKSDMRLNPYVDKTGRSYAYGEFFPSEFSFNAYNESSAWEFFPMDRDSSESAGFTWRSAPSRDLNGEKLIDAPDSPDSFNVTGSGIIRCADDGKCNHQCSERFLYLPAEVDFYKRAKLPLPDKCFNCRHMERMYFIRPFRITKRSCRCDGATSKNRDYSNTAVHFHGVHPCPNEFETSYAPDRPEIIYCEQCYNAEIA